MTHSSSFKTSHLRQSCLALILAAGCATASAAPENITRGELALLPEYCPDTQTFSADDARTSSKGERWRALFGPTFAAMHHYCWGLINFNRAKDRRMPAQARQGLLESSINDYQYVLKFAPAGFPLLPEIYLRIGEAALELKTYDRAFEAFSLSRQTKPDYWPPYARWADALKALGKKGEALAHLELGLRLMPQERALIGPYEKLGGNYAKFVKKVEAAQPSTAASAAQ